MTSLRLRLIQLSSCLVLFFCLSKLDDDNANPVNLPECDLSHNFEAHFMDLFKSFDQWTHSSDSKSTGKFVHRTESYNPETYKNGKNCNGMLAPEGPKQYAISSKFDTSFDPTQSDFVIQYSVRTHSIIGCGGAYIKLLRENKNEPFESSTFSNTSPFVIMFGPDHCGVTDKVHFIFQYKNPISGKYVEHHLKNAPSFPKDEKSHLYTLVIQKNNRFNLLIDYKSVAHGSLMKDFDPPVVPPKIIDDPKDVKPSDWVDEKKIPDPEASKPEDWDEDAQPMINDPKVSKPEGWHDDEPLQIPDPNAKHPEDWDSLLDGDWHPPLIDNPKCKDPGCGLWEHPQIANPEYRGKWYPPMIDNPDYKGEFKPRQISNPHYFYVDHIEIDPMSAVGVEILTIDGNIEFSDFLVYKGERVLDFAKKIAENTFFRRKKAESLVVSEEKKEGQLKMASLKDYYDNAFEFLTQHSNIAFAVFSSFVGIVPLLFYFICRKRDRKSEDKRLKDSTFDSTFRESEVSLGSSESSLSSSESDVEKDVDMNEQLDTSVITEEIAEHEPKGASRVDNTEVVVNRERRRRARRVD